MWRPCVRIGLRSSFPCGRGVPIAYSILTALPTMNRLPAIFLAACLAALVPVPVIGQESAPVEGRITRIGLFAGGDPILRSGTWSFVEVELRSLAAGPFGGELRLEQRDRDGDIVISRVSVALEPNGDWRPYQVYFVPYDLGIGGSVHVTLHDEAGDQLEIIDEKGSRVAKIESPSASDLSPDELLIVDIASSGRLPHVALLDVNRRRQEQQVNRRRVRSMAPRELPQRAEGLDAVDAITWDEADPSELNGQQIDALIEWVKGGGRLLITAGKNWRSLAGSPLADALPVTLRGVEERTEAQEFTDIVSQANYSGRLDRHYAKNPFQRCLMTPREGAIALPANCPNPQICFRRQIGRGVLTFLGASLNQLLPAPKKISSAVSAGEGVEAGEEKDPFIEVACERVLARRLLSLPPVFKEEPKGWTGQGTTDLFQVLRSSIAFEGVGTKFLIFAILFATAYTFVATVGSYWYLKKRTWLHHGWTAFGIVSIAGSVLGTGMVGMLRGVTKSLWQTSVVDGFAGQDEAHAGCLFGIKTPNHTRLDITLPVGEQAPGLPKQFGPLRAVPGSADTLERPDSQFASASSYECLLAGERLAEVPVRATLKEIQGDWDGPLPGRFEGRIVLRRPDQKDSSLRYEFAPGSFLRNGLGVPLKDCYLFLTDEETAGEGVTVLANYFLVGDLAEEGVEAELSDAQLRQRLLSDPRDKTQPLKTMPRLSDKIGDWAGEMRSFMPLGGGGLQPSAAQLTGSDEYTSVLLLSFFDLLREDPSRPVNLRRGHGRRLDCTKRLTRMTALLIGRSEAPGPARLMVDQKGLAPSQSNTIYRIVIPVERVPRVRGEPL